MVHLFLGTPLQTRARARGIHIFCITLQLHRHNVNNPIILTFAQVGDAK